MQSTTDERGATDSWKKVTNVVDDDGDVKLVDVFQSCSLSDVCRFTGSFPVSTNSTIYFFYSNSQSAFTYCILNKISIIWYRAGTQASCGIRTSSTKVASAC